MSTEPFEIYQWPTRVAVDTCFLARNITVLVNGQPEDVFSYDLTKSEAVAWKNGKKTVLHGDITVVTKVTADDLCAIIETINQESASAVLERQTVAAQKHARGAARRRSYLYKLTASDAVAILEDSRPIKTIAADYKVSYGSIWNVKRGVTFGWVKP